MQRSGPRFAKDHDNKPADFAQRKPSTRNKGVGICERAKAAKTKDEKQTIVKELASYESASPETVRRVKRLCGPVSTPKRKRKGKRG